MNGLAPILLGALAGGMLAVGAREAVSASPALAAWLLAAVEPLRRAGREGYTPTDAERKRLALVGAGAFLGMALLFAGPGPLAILAAAGPGAAGWAVASRRARYRRSVERRMPEIATAVADALAGGRSVRGALASATASLEGPPAAEMARLAADISLGIPTSEALAGLRRRLESQRVEVFCSALLSQQVAGGDSRRRGAVRRADRPWLHRAAAIRRRRAGDADRGCGAAGARLPRDPPPRPGGRMRPR